MANTDTTPAFNLKVVVRETGIRPDTLRAWERRYGLPAPGRSEGGHRRYSQRDIEILKWLTHRLEEGMQISRAVELWRSLEADGRDPLKMSRYRQEVESLDPSEVEGGRSMSELRKEWLEACLDFDESRAEAILTQGFAQYSPETVFLHLLQPALREIGDGWYRAEIYPQQEHFASELSIRRLESMVSAAPPPTRSGNILIGCPPTEEHVFPPLLMTFLLRRRGWRVTYLGADVPAELFEKTFLATRPSLVILTAQQLFTASRILDMTDVLSSHNLILGYGGLAFNRSPGLRERIPGHFLGEELLNAPQKVESLLLSAKPAPAPSPPSRAMQAARDIYVRRQRKVEAYIWNSPEAEFMEQVNLEQTNFDMARNLRAALRLGNLNFLAAELDWVRGLLVHFKQPKELLDAYLRIYAGATEAVLGEEGRPITEWLREAAQSGASD